MIPLFVVVSCLCVDQTMEAHVDVPEIARMILNEDASTPDDVATVGKFFSSQTIYHFQAGEAQIWSGKLVRIGSGFGEVPEQDDFLLPGLYVNLSPRSAAVVTAFDATIIGPLELVQIMDQATTEGGAPVQREPSSIPIKFVMPEADGPGGGGPRTCVVECGPGYYPCCNSNPLSCVCKQVSIHAQCSSGGPGAVTCGISEGPIQP